MDEHASYAYFEDINLGLLRLWDGRTKLRVLDVGCGFATTSQRIQKLGNEVTGIESSPAACEVAATRISRIVEGDLTAVDLGAERYDVIILADVLEHIPWPIGVLKRYLQWLVPGGSAIVSLPNVGLWSVRFKHLAGRWDYEETGVLDRTHLRFFTRSSARSLLHQAGLVPVKTTYNPGIVRPFVPFAKKLLGQRRAGDGTAAGHDPSALLNSRPYRLYLDTVYPVERAIASLWPGMFAFQMIFEAKRAQ
jgi:SAM-dependent methyltransferase